MENYFVEVLKIVVAVSIFFVWVPRYDNIIVEFKKYNYPDWLRDMVGILKLTFALMLILDDRLLILTGAGGLILLMIGALGTHFKIKNNVKWMIPAISQILMNGYILYMTY